MACVFVGLNPVAGLFTGNILLFKSLSNYFNMAYLEKA